MNDIIRSKNTELPPIFNGIEAVCFDAFGTLVEITDRRRPLQPLFEALSLDKRQELKFRIMREGLGFKDWPEALGAEVDLSTMIKVKERMLIETSSIALRPGIADIWARLRGKELRLALCSNLASDYVAALRATLPSPPDVEVLSCEVGAIKPEPTIYAAVLSGLQIKAAHILFTGDTQLADIEGPRAAGMKAMHIDELSAAMLVD